MNKLIYSFLFLLLLSLQCTAQDFMSYDGDTVCLLDKNGYKQGEWLFFENNNSIIMACEFKNDTLINNRVFYRGKDAWMVRYAEMDGKEAFTVVTTGQRRINGYFASKDGSIHLENAADSAFCPFDSLAYFVGIPGKYFFPSTSAEKYFSMLCAPLKQKFFDNLATVTFSIKSNGLVSKIDIQLKNKDKKLEKELNLCAVMLRRWQPAFRHNATEPFTYTIKETFEPK